LKDIYLIRHTTPDVAKGICYGQTDLGLTDHFFEEAELIRQHLPPGILAVHSSPLQRCARLAVHLFPNHSIIFHDELKEIHCGDWEMKSWDELPKEQIEPWMEDFVQVRIPGGESYLDLHARVNGCLDRIRGKEAEKNPDEQVPGAGTVTGTLALVAHGGVIRSLLSRFSGTLLIDSFKLFSLHYGCVVRLFEREGTVQYEILYNQTGEEKEQHKPSGFYKK
jgi:alpha-ribazole phosphatase